MDTGIFWAKLNDLITAHKWHARGIRKIISGGQTGADIGGLVAGKLLGLKTGGTAPKGWITEDGPNYLLGFMYGLSEGPPGYRERTKINIADSDATLILGNVNSPGSKLTLETCEEQGKLYLVNPEPLELTAWLENYDIRVLNVAGNRESKNPGIGVRTIQLLSQALKKEDK